MVNNPATKDPKDGLGMSETQTVLLVVGEERERGMSSTWRGGQWPGHAKPKDPVSLSK